MGYEENEEEFDYSPVYYKILLTRQNKLCVVCLQDFDECDYNQDKFLKDEEGEAYKFMEKDGGERKAKEFLNKNFKPEYINEDDLIPNNEYMYKRPQSQWLED
jgi:hypothetical protein